jgi:hypothetical protein
MTNEPMALPRAFLTLDLNQHVRPPTGFHNITKFLEGKAFKRGKAPRPNERRATTGSYPRFGHFIGGFPVGRQHSAQPRRRLLDLSRRRMDCRRQSTTRNAAQILRLETGHTARTARLRERRRQVGTSGYLSEADLQNADARWRPGLRRRRRVRRLVPRRTHTGAARPAAQSPKAGAAWNMHPDCAGVRLHGHGQTGARFRPFLRRLTIARPASGPRSTIVPRSMPLCAHDPSAKLAQWPNALIDFFRRGLA